MNIRTGKISSELSNVKIAILFGLSQALLIGLCLQYSFYIPFFIIGTGLIFFTLRNTLFSVLVLVFLHFFIIQGTEGVSLAEVLVGLYLLSVFCIWFFRRRFIQSKPILEDGTDWMFVLFLFFCIFSFVPAVLFAVSLTKWFRELVPFLTLLVFFPLRDSLKSKQDVRFVLLAVLGLSLIVAFRNLIHYGSAVRVAEMYWQITALRATSNEPLFFVPMVVAISIFLFSHSVRVKMAMALLFLIFGVVLVVTFSRGYWIATGFALIVFFVLVPPGIKMRSLIYLSILLGLSGTVIALFFGDFGKLIVKSVFERFLTIQSFFQDPSVRNRILEARALIRFVGENPVLGYGLGKNYEFISILPREMPTAYIHNAFLFLLFKVGLAGFIFFVLFYGAMILKGLRTFWMQQDVFLKAVLVGITSCLIAMLPLSFSSPQFYQKDSVLLITVGISILHALGKIPECTKHVKIH